MTLRLDGATVYLGDCLERLKELPAGSVQMCVTSPPYFGLRDYGTGTWEGGDPDCDHVVGEMRRGLGLASSPASTRGGGHKIAETADIQAKHVCPKCGARRVDQQIGLEETPDAYIARMVEVFREVRRVLADDGTLWLNIGDSYAGAGGQGKQGGEQFADRVRGKELINRAARFTGGDAKPKDLIGIPWMLAFALRADGWYLRQDIIWHKPNPMPESVRDRCTKAHEYVFLLSKSERYFYDAEAIKEPFATDPKENYPARARITGRGTQGAADARGGDRDKSGNFPPAGSGRNRRSVWTVATRPYKGAHFAVFPPALIEPCILAGTSERGHCPACGARWVREIERQFVPQQDVSREKGVRGAGDQKPMDESNSWQGIARGATHTSTTGWRATCDCGLDPVPDVVLDPFNGSGTTGQVAIEHGREYVGAELNPEYLELTRQRLESVIAERAAARAAAETSSPQMDLFSDAAD